MFRIKELRLEQNLTQRELAQKIYSTDKNIWAYENKIATPPLETLVKLADFFNCSIDYLIGRTDDFGNINIINSNGELAHDEKQVLCDYKKLSPKLQALLIEYLGKLVEISKMDQ